MAWRRRAKKLLKAYVGFKSAKWLGTYGLATAAGLGAYRWWKSRPRTHPSASAA